MSHVAYGYSSLAFYLCRMIQKTTSHQQTLPIAALTNTNTVFTYLEGVEEWVPINRWIIRDLDITEQVVVFRKRSNKLAEAGEILSDNRVLSLSNIFVFTAAQSSSCLHRFQAICHQHVLEAFCLKQGWDIFPVTVRNWCSELDSLISSHINLPLRDMKKLSRSYESIADHVDGKEGQELRKTTELLSTLMNTFSRWSDV